MLKVTLLRLAFLIVLVIHMGLALLLLMSKSPEHILAGTEAVSNNLPTIFLTCFVAIYFSTIIHELGHAFVGTAYGLPLSRIMVSPIMLEFEPGRIRIGRMRLKGVGGAVVFGHTDKPPSAAIVARRAMAIAGPLANLALTGLLVLFAVTFFADRPSTQLKIMTVAVVSGLMFVGNMIPRRIGFLTTDGDTFFRLRCEKPASVNEIRSSKFGEWLQKPCRPSERPADLLWLADELLRSTNEHVSRATKALAAFYLYECLANRGNLAEALAWVEWTERSLERPAKPGRGDPVDALTALRARHYALWNGDPFHAELTLRALHQRSWIRSYTEWMMPTALVQASRGDLTGARRSIAKSRRALKPLLDRSGSARLESQWLDIIEQRISFPHTFPMSPMPYAETAAD